MNIRIGHRRRTARLRGMGLKAALAAACIVLVPAAQAASCKAAQGCTTVSYFHPTTQAARNQYASQGGRAYLNTLCTVSNPPPSTGTVAPPPVCQDIDLKGYLFQPASASRSGSRLPLIVYVSGLPVDNDPDGAGGGDMPANYGLAQYFTDRGYVVLQVMRRGWAPSTGVNEMDYFSGDLYDGNATHDAQVLQYYLNQSFELQEAVNFMKGYSNRGGQPLVDASRIAMIGETHGGEAVLQYDSVNGVVVALAAGVDPTVRPQAAAILAVLPGWHSLIDETGAEDSAPTIAQLKLLVSYNHQGFTPQLFLQPRNDPGTRATVLLSAAAGDVPTDYQGSLFPDVDLSRYPSLSQPYQAFISAPAEVDKWGPAAELFFKRYWFPVH